MSAIASVLLLCALPVERASAQLGGPFTGRFFGMAQNSVTSSGATGDTLWIGPGLNHRVGAGSDWVAPEGADSVFAGRGRVFSLDVRGDTVFAGIGATIEISGGSEPAALGYYLSTDGGDGWNFLPFPLDPAPTVQGCSQASDTIPAGCDTTFTYGERTYSRIRVTVAAQSPPYEVDRSGDVLMSVNWASGLLRSLDAGATWERMPLPPFNAAELVPERGATWLSQTSGGATVERYDPRYDNNLLGFGLLLDAEGRTWVGTAGGVNISGNARLEPLDRVSWRHVRHRPDEAGAIPGDWVIRIRQNPADRSIWMTHWPAVSSTEQYAISVTRDGGRSFQTFLPGEKINDIGFSGQTIYAAGNSLFISPDGGASWRKVSAIRSDRDRISDRAVFYTVSTGTDGVFVGSSEGLLHTTDGGITWSIERTGFPLSGGNVYLPDAATVTGYAYPNPFSPDRHGYVRFRFQADRPGRYTLRLYDAAMDRVHEVGYDVPGPGEYEILWDGIGDRGARAHNGVYFGVVKGPGFEWTSRLLILN